jgi:hypothetical protein
MQGVDHCGSIVLAYALALFGSEFADVALVLVEGAELQGLLGNLTLISLVQIEELLACVRHAIDLDHALPEACFVARVIVADELAAPIF